MKRKTHCASSRKQLFFFADHLICVPLNWESLSSLLLLHITHLFLAYPPSDGGDRVGQRTVSGNALLRQVVECLQPLTYSLAIWDFKSHWNFQWKSGPARAQTFSAATLSSYTTTFLALSVSNTPYIISSSLLYNNNILEQQHICLLSLTFIRKWHFDASIWPNSLHPAPYQREYNFPKNSTYTGGPKNILLVYLVLIFLFGLRLCDYCL